MPKVKIGVYFTTAFMIMGLWGKAQEYARVDTLSTTSFGLSDGLLQLEMHGITQDTLGYLWLGSQDGLYRFNGEDFKVFNHSPMDSLSIADDFVLDVQAYKEVLLVATKTQGVLSYDLSKDLFSTLVKGQAYDIFDLEDDRLLFPLKNKLAIYDFNDHSCRYYTIGQSQENNVATDLIKVGPDRYLLTTTMKGILLLDLEKQSVTPIANLDGTMHRSILKSDDIYYVGTDMGFYSATLDFKEIVLRVPGEKLNDLTQKEDHVLWLATNNGVFSYNTKNHKLTKLAFKNQNGKVIGNVIIYQIFDDGKGNYFFGTVGEGLWHYNAIKKKFTTLKLEIPGYSKSKKQSSFQYMPYKDSTLFIGSTHNIVKYDHRKKTFKHYDSFPKSVIWTLVKDSMNTIWTGGYKTGLLTYDPLTDTFVPAEDPIGFFKDKIIMNITPLGQHELLIGTYFNNTHLYNARTGKATPFLIDGRPLFQSRVSYIDRDQNLWLGTDQNGLYRISPVKEVLHFHTKGDKKTKITHNRINGIAEDSKGRIWIATSAGLNRYDPEGHGLNYYYNQKGFPNDYIYSIQVDKSDRVWLSTGWGLSVLDPIRDTFKNYTVDDGLQHNEFKTKASYQDEFGNLYFGGVDGINIFHPDAIPRNDFRSKVYIESIDLFNEPLKKNVLFTDRIEFKSDDDVITFNYAAINFLNPNKVTYSYFLEGFDKQWRTPTHIKSATYTNLDPKTYTFKVKATNDEGVWSEYTDAMEVTITPPWYNTPIFKVSTGLVFFGGLFFFFLYRAHHEKKTLQKLERIIAQRTGEIVQKNNDLQKAYQESENQKENIRFLIKELKHRTKNNLQIISSLLNIQSHQLEDGKTKHILQVAKNRILTMSYLEEFFDTESEIIAMEKFIRELCDKILAVLNDENIMKFKVQYDLEPFAVKMPKVSILGLIINELLTNTVKHAFASEDPKNKLHISCTKDSDSMVLVIKDNGKGYDVEKAYLDSLGMDLVKGLVQQIEGSITITSNKSGTINRIQVPVEPIGEA